MVKSFGVFLILALRLGAIEDDLPQGMRGKLDPVYSLEWVNVSARTVADSLNSLGQVRVELDQDLASSNVDKFSMQNGSSLDGAEILAKAIGAKVFVSGDVFKISRERSGSGSKPASATTKDNSVKPETPREEPRKETKKDSSSNPPTPSIPPTPPQNSSDYWSWRLHLKFKWYSSLGSAVEAAKPTSLPILVVLYRDKYEKGIVDHMAGWTDTMLMSNEKMASVLLDASAPAPEVTEIIKKAGIQSFPVMIWMDTYQNPLLSYRIPDSVQPITATVKNWQDTLGNVGNFFRDLQRIGDANRARGRLREAYQAYSMGASFSGPVPEKLREAKEKIKAGWMGLLEAGKEMQPRDRKALVYGLRRDTRNTDVMAEVDEKLKAFAVNDKSETSAPARVTVPTSSVPAVQTKSLAEIAAMSTSSSNSNSNSKNSIIPSTSIPDEDEGAVTKKLSRLSKGRYSDAIGLFNEGMISYKKALSDSSDRGAERNELLGKAKENFEKALAILEGGGTQFEGLMQDISMFLYGCLKYQSL